MNLVYLSTLGTYAVRKERGYPYFELVELRPRCSDHHWETICGFSTFAAAVNAAECQEEWEIFGKKSMVNGVGVPKEDLPPHEEPPAVLHNIFPPL